MPLAFVRLDRLGFKAVPIAYDHIPTTAEAAFAFG
jgi:hypothetical protein